MALEEIAVADIRKGQELLVIMERSSMGDPHLVPNIITAGSDGYGWQMESSATYYLLADIPTPPPFEVPWGTVQRDKNDDVWQFESEVHKDAGVIAYCDGVPMQRGLLETYAPFTRMYTVLEMVEAIEKTAGQTPLSRELLHMKQVGDI